MIKTSLKALLITSLSLSTLAHAITATDPVGVVKITIEAATAANNPTYSFLSTSMSQEVAYQGVVSAGGTGTITIGNNDWTADQFKSVPYYVIVASGPREGEMLDIASNTANTLTLSGGPATENQNDLVGQTIRIHKHNTIASIFGANPLEGTVKKGNNSTADQILLFNPSTASYLTFYWNNETDPLDPSIVEGWVNSIDLSQTANNTIIYPDDGFIYKRVATSTFTTNVSGNVILNKIQSPIINGYNLVCIPYPVNKNLTLATSKLYPSNPLDFDINKHLKAGNLTNADQLLFYQNGSFQTYYYNNEVDPLDPSIIQGWVSAADTSTSAANVQLPTGGFFILRRSGSPAFNWEFSNVIISNEIQ